MCAGNIDYGIGNSMSRNPLPRRSIRLVLLAVLVVSTIAGPVGAAPSIAVDDPTVRGSTIIETTDDDHVAGWKSHSVNATVSGDPGEYYVCLTLGSAVDKQEIDCTSLTLNSDEQTVSFDRSAWPDNTTGPQTVSVEVYDSSADEEPLTTASTQVTVLSEGEDSDSDGVINSEEINKSTDPTRKDTDGDGLDDGLELHQTGSNPTKKHSDNDTLADGVEWDNNLPLDPTLADSDRDGLRDDTELTNHGTNATDPDTDGDTLSDQFEVNNNNTSATKADTDGDGIPDNREINRDTEPDNPDTDNDGLDDGVEVNKHDTDPTHPDTDRDGLSDGKEIHKHHTNPQNADTDGDGVDDATEIKRGTNPVDQKFFLLAPMRNPLETAATIVGVGLCFGLGVRWWQNRDETPTAVEHTNKPKPSHESAEPAPPTEPLTDEDQIQQLLGEHNGRMHQSEIVTATGWSKSKVSRLLTRMENDGQISKISVGRENLITRPDDEPKHAGSTFDD